MIFWKKKKSYEHEIEDIKHRLTSLEASIKRLEQMNVLLGSKIDAVSRSIDYTRSGIIKVTEGLIELVKTLKQNEITDHKTTPRIGRMPHQVSSSQKDQIVEQPKAALRDEIIMLLSYGNKMTAKEITDRVKRTREHVSRVLRDMTLRGIISRQKIHRAFVYSIEPVS